MSATTRSARRARAAGLALGVVLDAALGDPRRFHPVAGFGAVANRLEAVTYADRRAAGIAHVGLLVGGVALTGVLLERAVRERPVARALVTAAATWTVLGGTTLVREAESIQARLGEDDLPGARAQITALVSRDPTEMDHAAIVRACVESVAENTSDAVTGPFLWGALAGVPGLLMYRAVNTLDAMIGYRNERYERFGWAAARGDDLLNLLPARVTAALVMLASPLVGGSPRTVWRTVRRDAPAHPSPNGGMVEASFAGALGIVLGGVNSYGGQIQDRGTLGDGAPAATIDIARAARLSRIVALSVSTLAIATARSIGAAVRRARPGQRPRGPRRAVATRRASKRSFLVSPRRLRPR